MDDATSLVSELIEKLSELEQKVEHHRQDMATEFRRYSRQLLHDVPGDVSAQVEKAIKDSIHNYPAIGSALDHENPIRTDSRKTHHNYDRDMAASSDRRRRGRGSPPPLLPHTSGTPPEIAPRSPHEREREFQGLFTPSYLPLLAGAERHSRGDTLSPPTSPPALPLTQPESGKLIRDPVQAERSSLPPTTLSKPANRRPDPIRRHTEDSYTSDESTSRGRRSALRRSSSSSTKTQSPRRVRFEVEGGEVLPTASPPMSPRFVEHQASPLGTTANHMDSSHDSAPGDEKAEEPEADDIGLLGSSPPRPKKITSTDRLKALTRNSKEDTSKWTVVGDLRELDEDEDVLMMGNRTTKPSAALQAESAANADTLRQKTHTPAPFNMEQPLEDMEEMDEDEDEDENEEDEGSPEMPPLSSFKGKKRFSPPHSAANSPHDGSNNLDSALTRSEKGPQTTSEPIAVSSRRVNEKQEDEEELFEYESDEEEDLSKEPRRNEDSKPTKYIEEIDDDLEDESSRPSAAQPLANLSLYATSPAISISKTAPAETTTPPSRYTASIGSYKGKPYVMSSVKDEKILEKAAKMGDFESFVGSIHDRPGVDVSTSYRPDQPQFYGSPKSFSQRLLMEEFLEAKKKAPDTGNDE